MRDNSHSAEEYRDWIIDILHQCGRDELIALIVPYGESEMLKACLNRTAKLASKGRFRCEFGKDINVLTKTITAPGSLRTVRESSCSVDR